MPKKTSVSNRSKRLPNTVIVAIIAGIFALGTTILTVIPNWITVLKSDKPILATPIPTWPPFPLLTGPIRPTATAAPLRLSNFELVGNDSIIPDNYKPSDLLNTPVYLRTASTSSDISLKFDVTGISQIEWVKVDNHVLFYVERFDARLPGDRDNILKGSPIGGGSVYTNFNLSVKGAIKPGDTLISPPSPNVDFFTLTPGEKMTLKVTTRWEIPSGAYSIRLGLTYEYEGELHTIWSDTMTIISPQNAIFWTCENGNWVTITSP
jgi:hypothetical protein